ncbi:MAG: hypothetical protein ACYTBY_02125 [Planctomycetota bacterium]|jgi:hypothetical protein
MGMFSEFFAEVEDVFIEGDGQYDLEVVGESHYQRHLNENTNPHDKKAIRAVINGGTVGYLSRKDARLFRKRIEKVGFEGLVISCNAEILGGKRVGLFKKTDFGVWLDLPIKKL